MLYWCLLSHLSWQTLKRKQRASLSVTASWAVGKTRRLGNDTSVSLFRQVPDWTTKRKFEKNNNENNTYWGVCKLQTGRFRILPGNGRQKNKKHLKWGALFFYGGGNGIRTLRAVIHVSASMFNDSHRADKKLKSLSPHIFLYIIDIEKIKKQVPSQKIMFFLRKSIYGVESWYRTKEESARAVSCCRDDLLLVKYLINQ